MPIPELTDKLLNAKDIGGTPDTGKAVRQILDSVALPTHDMTDVTLCPR